MPEYLSYRDLVQTIEESIHPVILNEPLPVGCGKHRVEIPCGEVVVPMAIPQYYLFGTQLPHVYSDVKREKVEKALRNYGYEYLENDPVLACLIGNPHLSQLAILDGHHNARYAPKLFGHGVEIPTIIISPATAAKIYYGGDTDRCMLDLDKSLTKVLLAFAPRLHHADKEISQSLFGSTAEDLWVALNDSQAVPNMERSVTEEFAAIH